MDASLKTEMDAALNTLLRENYFFRYDVFSRIYGVPTYSYDNFTEAEREFILKRQTVTIIDDSEGIGALEDVNREFWGKVADYSGLEFSFGTADGGEGGYGGEGIS